ncbi:retention module-containing protein [Aeromonas veronii]|uniref:retention module-containing protein n=1 Tax=Aeromonas veronii TaxID=654 RepID=UPI0024447BFA|nr:retention module-containing protein [Aeromonas veronii]
MITNAVTLEQGVTVTQLKGQIYLVAADGSRKLLAEGDVLPKGAVIMSPDGASFMGGGQSFTVQPASEQSEPAEEGDAPQLAQNGAAGTPDDINALQQAILGGADPTQAFEASAAGGAPAAGGGGIGGVAGASGNGGFVTIDRVGDATISQAGFDTTYNDGTAPTLDATGIADQPFISANLPLSAQPQVNEGGSITFTASVDVPVFGTDLVITLSNGAVITIPAGQTTGSVTVAAPADSPYVDPSTITVSIIDSQGGGFNQIITGPSTTTQITDTVDETRVSLSATGSLTEAGGIITYTATLTSKAQGDVTVTLDNGKTITIKDGATTGSVEVTVADRDDVYKESDSVSAKIESATGGNFESLVVDKTPAVTQITDTVDETRVSLSATGVLTEAGGIITYTATLTSKAQGDVTVTLDNGKTITIKDGATTGSVEVTVADRDDVYKESDSVSAKIESATGGDFESLVVDKTPAVTQITDTVDETRVSLSATGVLTEAGGIITYTATLTSKAQGDVTVTLDNGKTITIKDGATTGSVEVTVADRDDVYKESDSVSAKIESATGGNFESLVVDKTPAVTQITDTVDETRVSLSATGVLTEAGGIITYTATLTSKAQGDVTVTLDNGKTITIKDGATTGSVEVTVADRDDVYKESDSVSAKIESATGGDFESLVVDKTPAVTQITDTVDETRVSLSATGVLTEAGGIITYTATLTSKAQGDVTVTLDNGKTITIKDGATTGSVEVTVADRDDVYKESDSVSAKIESATGGDFESLVVDKTPAVTQITDTVDETRVSLSATGVLTEAGGIITYTATLTSKAQGDVTVTLDNGKTITIKDGATTGSVEVTVADRDDVYKESDSVSAKIESATGGDFESLVVDKTPAVTQITDTTSEVVATLTADKNTVAEGGQVTYTVTLSNANGLLVSGHNGLSFTLSNGQSITIAAGQTSGSVKLTAGDDVYSGGQPALNVKLTGVSGGDDFEKLTLGKETVTTTVTDEPNGEGDKATVLLSGPASVVEGSLTGEYTVTLSHAAKPGDKVLLSYSYTTASGDDIVETKEAVIGVDGKTAKFTIATVNDVRIEGSENFAVSVSKVLNAAGQDVFEGLDTSAAKVTTTIVDNDSVVSLQAVVEGTTGNVLNVADGVAFTGATALGGTVSLMNGKYVYQAPVRDHADSVADTDSFTYTKADGSTVTYNINILDTNPLAANDSGSFAVGLNVQTAGSISLLANDTVVDSSVAKPATVHSATGLNGTAVELGAAGSVTVAGKYGDLTVNANGSYTYTSKLDSDVQAVEGGPAVKSAFAVYGFQNNSLPLNGTSLNLTGLTDSATALVDVRTSGNNAKPGIGVSQSGGGTNDIGSGESLVIGLKALSNFAQIGINELNSGQGSASWKAYDANGVLVGSGILVSSSSNGGLQSFNISTNTPFQYLVLGYSGNQNGYVVDSIKYTPAIGAVTEEFTYTVKDNDGDVSNSAVLTLNGNVPTTVAPTMLMGVEDTDVTLTWASFGISDNASTVRISGNQDGTGTILYLDASTNQYKELGKNETKTFTKADIDSGKVKFDPEDNVSGADVYGNDKGVGNKGHDLTSIKFDVLKGNQVIASDKSVVVDIVPVADKPLLSLSGFQSLAAINFEDVNLGGSEWRADISINSVQGASTIGVWNTLNNGGKVEVGTEKTYTGGTSTNKVMEIEANHGDKTLYTDFDCEAGRFYQLGFDVAARLGNPGTSDMVMKLVRLDAIGNPISGTEKLLYNFDPTDSNWLRNQTVSLPIDVSGKYRLIFEAVNADSTGAILDNIKFQAVDNKGYEDSFIKLSAINAALVDVDGSERLAVEISGLPKGGGTERWSEQRHYRRRFWQGCDHWLELGHIAAESE